MKYLAFLLSASVAVAQITHGFQTRGGNTIETYKDPNKGIASRVCFINGTHVDCLGVFSRGDGKSTVEGICSSDSYGNGNKETPNGDCCKESNECKGTCSGFACI